jgi:hypothetical protein
MPSWGESKTDLYEFKVFWAFHSESSFHSSKNVKYNTVTTLGEDPNQEWAQTRCQAFRGEAAEVKD